jgi:hypothetical protein
VELGIPKLREGSFFPALLEPRRRIDRALLAVVMEAYVHGTSTRKVDDLVKALGVDNGISKSEVSRICAELDTEVAGFRSRSLAHTSFPYVFLDATYLKASVAGRVVSRAVVIATGVTADGGREVLGLDVGDSEDGAFWTAVGAGRALAAGPTTPALRRPAPHHLGSGLLGCDRVHGADLDPVAAAAGPGAWLWLAGDLLASADRVDPDWGVRRPPPHGPRPAGDGGPVGLVPGERGLDERAGQAWGDHVGANPVDRGTPGSKLHLVCDGSGLPLTAAVTAANVADVTMLAAVIDDIPPVRTPSGRRRWRPANPRRQGL